MKRIALIHTVQSVCTSFEPALRAAFAARGEEIKVNNILDDFLAFDALPQESGVFTEKNKDRLWLDLLSAELTGADLIVTTCSQISPTVKEYEERLRTPVITIDEAMAAEAIRISRRVGLLSTASGTVPYVKETIRREARRQRKRIRLEILCDNEAIAALRRGEMAKHDELVRALARKAEDCDSIIMAQASAAHMRDEVARLSGAKTLTGVETCIRQVLSFFGEEERGKDGADT